MSTLIADNVSPLDDKIIFNLTDADDIVKLLKIH